MLRRRQIIRDFFAALRMTSSKWRATGRVQKMLNRRINSWRASIACSGFIRLSIFSRRSRSIAASSRTSWLRAFHFAYLPQPMPSASSAETIQTVMSVEVTRSMSVENRSSNVLPSQQSSSGTREARSCDLTLLRPDGHFRHACPRDEPGRCVHRCLFCRCAPGAIAGGDFGESSRSISDRRDDPNSEAEKEEEG